MRLIYLSPHLDDAVLSAGGLIYEQAKAGTPVEIWTFTCGVPEEAELSMFARVLHYQWGTTSAEETVRIRRAEDVKAAKVMIDNGIIRFSAAQSYYTIFCLAQAMLLTKGLTFSKHSAVAAAYGREFARTGLPGPKFHRYIIDAQERRQVGHYGDEHEEVTEEQALESFQWAGEFMEAVKMQLSRA